MKTEPVLAKYKYCLILAIAATAITSLNGCSTSAPSQKQYAAVFAIASDGVYGQWATNNHTLQALDQSFTKVIIAKKYSVCPIAYDRHTDSPGFSGTPDALDQLAVKLGKESKVEYLFLAVLNQATTGNKNETIRLNIISKMFKLGNDYEHDEIVATHEWPEGGKDKTISGDSQAIVQAIQKAAEETASKYPNAVDISKAGR